MVGLSRLRILPMMNARLLRLVSWIVGASTPVAALAPYLFDGIPTSAGRSMPWLLGASALALELWARRAEAPTATEELLRDRRPCVVYLRSFGSDRAERRLQVLALLGRTIDDTSEQVLVRELQRVGPVVALGRPGERLPELGAARMQVSNSRWESTVLELMGQCGYVLLRGGKTPGLTWEVRQAVERLRPTQLLLWFPAQLADGSYAAFRAWAGLLFPRGLPENEPRSTFVAFDRDWQPRETSLDDWVAAHEVARPAGGPATAAAKPGSHVPGKLARTVVITWMACLLVFGAITLWQYRADGECTARPELVGTWQDEQGVLWHFESTGTVRMAVAQLGSSEAARWCFDGKDLHILFEEQSQGRQYGLRMPVTSVRDGRIEFVDRDGNPRPFVRQPRN